MREPTPGPWTARIHPDANTAFVVGAPYLGIVAHITRGRPLTEQRIADTHVIAGALDLLTSLREITPPMPPVDAPCHRGIRPQAECAYCSRIARAHAAIAKATGAG